MNREDILRLARIAKLTSACITEDEWNNRIEYFFNLAFGKGAAAEREACAKECEHTALRMGSEWMAQHCAEAIRARGNS